MAEPVDPNQKLADYLTAEKLRSESKYTQAIRIFEKIIEKDPSDTGVRVMLADILAKAGETPKAIESYYLAANVYHGSGDHGRAAELLKKIEGLDREGRSIFLKKLRRTLGAAPKEPSVWSQPLMDDLGDEDGVSISLSAPLFKDLSPQARAKLVERMAVLNVRAGSIVYREGDPGSSLYVIGAGRVRLTFRLVREDGTTQERLFAELGPGEFFGEFSFLAATPRQFTARATSDGRIFQLPKASLDEVQRAHPGVAHTLNRFYKERVLDRVLAGSSLFGSLPADQRHEITERFVLESHPCGSVIIAEGSQGDLIYLIRQGEVRVTATGPGGEEVFLTNLHGNDFFGEFSFLTGKPRSASVVATSEVELLTVSRVSIEPILERYPDVLLVMRKAYFERMADNLHKLASSG